MTEQSASQQIVRRASELCPYINLDMTPEDATTEWQRVQAMRDVFKGWYDAQSEAWMEYVQSRPYRCIAGETDDGIQYYVVKHDKEKRIKKGKLLQVCMLVAGRLVKRTLTVHQLCECLVSKPFKCGALVKHIPDAAQYIETVVSDKPGVRKTMPPAMKARLASEQPAEGGGA